MFPDALPFEHRVAHGESLDLAIAAPLDGQPEDGDRFVASFKLSPADRDVALRFETGATAPPWLTTGAWDAESAKLVLSFQASKRQIEAMAPGAYFADVIHERPRQGPLGPRCVRIAVITLDVSAGGLEQ